MQMHINTDTDITARKTAQKTTFGKQKHIHTRHVCTRTSVHAFRNLSFTNGHTGQLANHTYTRAHAQANKQVCRDERQPCSSFPTSGLSRCHPEAGDVLTSDR